MDVVVVDLIGVALIVGIVWYFFLSRRHDEAVAASTGDVQEVQVVVRGGYIPDTIVARPGVALRIRFRREETSACSEEVVFPDFGIRRHLPAFETTPVEIPASPPGTYGFACGMDMMHGRLVLGAAAPTHASVVSAPVATTPELPVDPICGMRVDPERAAGTSVRDGQTVYFCGLGCKQRFDAGAEQAVTLGVRRKA